MRLGIYGGSFSPIHNGHLLLAESCREQCGLNEVWFLPAASNPLKQDVELASDAHRTAMVELAIAGNHAFKVSPIELERGGLSYTVDTLREVRQIVPHAELFLLIGGDSFASLFHWHKIEEICELATICTVGRPGFDLNDWGRLPEVLNEDQMTQIKQHFVEMPLIDLSSTEIRRRVTEGRSIRYMVPRSVEKYIETQHVFRNQPTHV
ncbi:nicotinate-nucleotide adenylyltransferase [Bremerella cremea]|uniref:nicotinate-nucleotide adenylyltransferase n=1 Tax=Bremerella cremea TaxID=1031537 RepID=UPI0031EB955E